MNNSNNMDSEKKSALPKQDNLLSVIGLCSRARQLTVGSSMVCDAVADGSALLVIEASDASQNTHKRLCDKCSYYKVRLVQIKETCETLARAIGKSGAVAAVAVKEKNLLSAVEKQLDIRRSNGEI